MDLRRLRAGEWIAAVSGAALVVSLFLPWYTVEAPAGGPMSDVTAWEAYSVVDVALALLGLLGIGLLVLTATQCTAAVGVAADALLTVVGAAFAIAATIRVLNLPDAFEVAGADRAALAWVGLLAAWGVVVGAAVAMRDERLSAPGRPTDATGVPLTATPEIETLPTPPRETADR